MAGETCPEAECDIGGPFLAEEADSAADFRHSGDHSCRMVLDRDTLKAEWASCCAHQLEWTCSALLQNDSSALQARGSSETKRNPACAGLLSVYPIGRFLHGWRIFTRWRIWIGFWRVGWHWWRGIGQLTGTLWVEHHHLHCRGDNASKLFWNDGLLAAKRKPADCPIWDDEVPFAGS